MINRIYRHWTLFSFLLLLLSGGWIWLSRDTHQTNTQSTVYAPQKGFSAPPFTLYDINNNPINLADLKGNVVLINFWASWCLPCRKEMPAMENVYRKYKDENFVVLAINVTSQDSRPKALDFYRQNNLTFPILFDTQGEIAKLYQVQSFPTSFFIDKNGEISDRIIGGPMASALIETKVEKLIRGEP